MNLKHDKTPIGKKILSMNLSNFEFNKKFSKFTKLDVMM